MLIVLHNETGRKILFGDTLKTVVNGQTEQYMISPEDRVPVLFREFGLTATSD